VSTVGSRESDGWEMKVWGPNGFERSYTLAGNAGEHQPLATGNVLLRLVPAKRTEDRKGRTNTRMCVERIIRAVVYVACLLRRTDRLLIGRGHIGDTSGTQ
jgi:hypothetical protein